MSLGKYSLKVLETARSSGLCRECPFILGILKEARDEDNEASSDALKTDVELEAWYESVDQEMPGVGTFLYGRDTSDFTVELREGREHQRQYRIALIMKDLGHLAEIAMEQACPGLTWDASKSGNVCTIAKRHFRND